MTAIAESAIDFKLGDLVRRKDLYGGGAPTEILGIGPCSKWPVDPPYYHECYGKLSIVILEKNMRYVSHADMYELANA